MQRKRVTQQFSRELLSGKAAILLAHSAIRLLFPQRWEEALHGWRCAAPPAWQRGCVFFSAELTSRREKSFFKFVRNVSGERGRSIGLEICRPRLSAWLATDFLHDFPSSFLSLLMHLSLLVIGVCHKQQPDSTSRTWEVQVYSTVSGKWVTPLFLCTVKQFHRERLPSSEGGFWLSPCYLPLMDK